MSLGEITHQPSMSEYFLIDRGISPSICKYQGKVTYIMLRYRAICQIFKDLSKN